MKSFLLLFTCIFSLSVFSQTVSRYKVLEGTLHRGGKVLVEILPIPDKFKVQMTFEIKKKGWVPVPSKLLEGKTVMEFPDAFRTRKGYEELETKKTMDIPKAQLKFVKKMDIGKLKDAYKIEVLPTNKKTKIEIIYHPDLPGVGWQKVLITFISNIPILNGYEIVAELRQ